MSRRKISMLSALLALSMPASAHLSLASSSGHTLEHLLIGLTVALMATLATVAIVKKQLRRK